MKKKKNNVTNRELVLAFRDPDNLSIIHKVCNQYRDTLSEDVLFTCGINGLWECLKSHRNDLGRKFTTSLHQFVDWQCKNQISSQSRCCMSVEHIADLEDESTPVLDRMVIQECVDALPENYRAVIIGKFYHGKSNAEMGRELGCSRQNVGELLQRAISAVRSIYLDD